MIYRLPHASVVVAAYDAERTIGECIESLLALDYPGELLEIVVVDNSSRDGTRAVLAAFGDAIRVVDESERGAAAARNAGIRNSSGDVIAFTDADCVVRQGWLRALVEPLGNPWVGVAGGRILATREANAAERFGEWIHDHGRALATVPPAAITMNWASRRAVLEEVGLFDVRLKRSSDADLAFRIGRAGYEFAYCAAAVVHHRNERSLAGLFREGWQHGFHIVPVRRRHERYLAAVKGRPVGSRRRRIRLYRGAFQLGKRVGAMMGRIRYAGRAVEAPSPDIVDGRRSIAAEVGAPAQAAPWPQDGRADGRVAVPPGRPDGRDAGVPAAGAVKPADDDPDAPAPISAARD